MALVVRLDPAAVREFVRADPQASRYFLTLGERVKQRAQQLVGYSRDVSLSPGVEAGSPRRRHLRDALVKRFVAGPDGVTVQVGFFSEPEASIATYHHEGTRPHRIRASRARALRFFWRKVAAITIVPRRGWPYTGYQDDQTFVIGKGFVAHPGTRPNPFLRRALEEVIRGAS